MKLYLPLKWARWRVTVRLESQMQLDDFPTSRLAGALGDHLRRLTCLHPPASGAERVCDATHANCGHPEFPLCVYGQLIRAQAPARGQAESERRIDIPRPLIVATLDRYGRRYEEGDIFAFDVTLVGNAVCHREVLLEAVQRVGRAGLGTDYREGFGRFRVESVRALDEHGAFAFGDSYLLDETHIVRRCQALSGSRLRFEFERPLRLMRRISKENSKTRVVREDELDFSELWKSLLQRLQDMCIHFGEGEPGWPYTALASQAREVNIVGRDLGWQRQHRYSGSQKSDVEASGIVGTLDIEGQLGELLPFLVLGEHLHVGKNTDLGEGHFRLVPL